MNDQETLLSVRDLTIALPRGGDREYAVRDVSYDIRVGEILCIVGESGSGKSMSANAIMGLLPDYLQPQGGQILFRGKDLLRQDEATLLSMRGKDMAMIFQEPLSALNPLMTVGEQIGEVMRVHDAYPGPQRQRRVLELLAFVGLPDPAVLCDVYPFRLSGGQRQRVMIAMALALEPALLIADEPTTALDVTTQAQILALIARIQKEKGMGVMFVTHDFGVVAEIAHRVAVMEQGILVEQGPAEEVLNRPQHPYTRRLIAAVPHRRADARPPVAQDAPVLAVDKLCKTYVTGHGWFGKKRVVRAVDEVSFEVRRGETLGIVGESGSGKSTIGKCLLKLIGIDGGKLVFNGRDIAGLSESQFRPLRKDIQMIFQDPFASLNPRMRVGDCVKEPMLIHNLYSGAQADRRAAELFERVGLDAAMMQRWPHEFSGGQRQRICIARALSVDPKVLIADESVSALDVSIQAQILNLLKDLQEQLGLTMLFISHDLPVIRQMCDRVGVMLHGQLLETAATETLFTHPEHDYTRHLLSLMPRLQSLQPVPSAG